MTTLTVNDVYNNGKPMTPRQQLSSLIGNAKDLPVQMRVAAGMFLAQMSDEQIEEFAGKAQTVIDLIQAGNKPALESKLVELGVPSQFVRILSDKALPNDIPNPVG